MSSEQSNSCGTELPMITSGSSVAEDTPESEHALSVLDFAHQYAPGTQQECHGPRSSRRKRRRDGPCQDEEQQIRHCCAYQLRHQTPNGRTMQCLQTTGLSQQPDSAADCQKSSSATYYVAIYGCLIQWCCRLKALQPKCIITKDVLHRTLDLFHRYRQATQIADLSAQGQGATAVHLASCLWIASKNDGNRACVPSRTLLTRAISVCPEELSQAELTVCCRLHWNLFNSQVASACQH
ncbi:TPA: hypothetical protein ACH3X1_009448 [Trebouxia sp. C0004]